MPVPYQTVIIKPGLYLSRRPRTVVVVSPSVVSIAHLTSLNLFAVSGSRVKVAFGSVAHCTTSGKSDFAMAPRSVRPARFTVIAAPEAKPTVLRAVLPVCPLPVVLKQPVRARKSSVAPFWSVAP